MDALESPYLRVRKSFLLAIGFSLLLHAAVLFMGYSSALPAKSGANADNSDIPPQRRLTATLARPPAATRPQPGLPRSVEVPANTLKKPAKTPIKASTKKPKEASKQQIEPKKLTAPDSDWANRSFYDAERADMNKFLTELASEAKPPSGQELSKRSLAMARQMGRSPQDDGTDQETKPAAGPGKLIEPYSLEMYFDAFLRKMNRSAAFVNNEPRVRGLRKALVEISLNSDGSLKSYRVLRSADQEAEIAYIKSVVERASPFSAFPPDIRKATDSLTMRMCIYPAHEGDGGGFWRSSGDQDCRG